MATLLFILCFFVFHNVVSLNRNQCDGVIYRLQLFLFLFLIPMLNVTKYTASFVGCFYASIQIFVFIVFLYIEFFCLFVTMFCNLHHWCLAFGKCCNLRRLLMWFCYFVFCSHNSVTYVFYFCATYIRRCFRLQWLFIVCFVISFDLAVYCRYSSLH